MRGLAIVVMIQCHAFNSFVRPDLRTGGAYSLSQFVGGMAAPLFLFMAGMTLAFQMDGMVRRELPPRRRWLLSLRRGGYILALAFLLRLSNWVAGLPHPYHRDLIKVDILNCMGVAMAAFSVAAVFDAQGRARFAVAAALAIALAAPPMANLDWGGTPALIQDYLVPGPRRGQFPFFPVAAYLGFGLAAGSMVKVTAADRLERFMQWTVLIGLVLVFGGQYFANSGPSIYGKSDFWRDSPLLVLMRVGISLLLLAAASVWTEFCAGPGWSFMQVLGKNSLLVYWVHLMLIYGNPTARIRHALTIPQTALATLTVGVLMLMLSVAWMRWKTWRAQAERRSAAARSSATIPR